MKPMFFLLAALAIGVAPLPAFARCTSAADDFAISELVSDNAMSSMRGGFFDVNGELISFGYNAVTSINGVIQNTISFSDTNLAHAAAGKDLQNIITPAIIQNAVNNVQIVTRQQLNMIVSGAHLNTPVLNSGAVFTNIRAFR